MNVLAWILSGLLAVAFIGAGTTKLLTPREKLLQNPRMGWAGDFTSAQIRTIAFLEVLGGVGVIGAWIIEDTHPLAPAAAAGLALVMLGALATHARRAELKKLLALPLCCLPWRWLWPPCGSLSCEQFSDVRVTTVRKGMNRDQWVVSTPHTVAAGDGLPKPWGKHHARRAGDPFTACGVAAITWRMLWNTAFSSAHPDACRDCATVIAATPEG